METSNQPAQETGITNELREILAGGEVNPGLQAVLKLLDEELFLRRGVEAAKKTMAEKLARLDLTRVQFGGGTHTLEGWTNIDIVEPADLVMDVREALPLPDQCSEQVFSEHMMEHLPMPNAVKWVSECHRILKPEGKLIIGVPDAGLAMQAYANGDAEYFAELNRRWYGKRQNMEDYNTPIDLVNLVVLDQENVAKYHRHYWGYDRAKLDKMLYGAGFSQVETWKFDPNLANPKREWGSIYVEATK